MKSESEFNKYRQIYIDNITNTEFPVLPAYYYYLNHTDSKQILSSSQFEELFLKSLQPQFNLISQEITSAVLNLDDVYKNLDNYYNVNELLTKENEFIMLV